VGLEESMQDEDGRQATFSTMKVCADDLAGRQFGFNHTAMIRE